jgi:hypothetical protein
MAADFSQARHALAQSTRNRIGGRDESCGPLGTSLLGRGRLSVKARMGLPGCAEAQAAACQVTRAMRREHACVVLPLAALLHAVVGGPVGQAVQVAPVLLPDGTELGVFLVPVGPPRGHGEPAGVAVFVLPSVCPADPIVIEHAEAADAPAVEGPPICYDRRHATTVSLLFDSRDQTKRVARPTSRPKTRTIPSAFVDVALDSPSMFNAEKCTLVHLSANSPLISPGGHFFWKCFLTETENDNKRPCARQQAAPRQMKVNLSNATHRVSPAGRRPPAAGKSGVGAARRIGGDARGGA